MNERLARLQQVQAVSGRAAQPIAVEVRKSRRAAQQRFAAWLAVDTQRLETMSASPSRSDAARATSPGSASSTRRTASPCPSHGTTDTSDDDAAYFSAESEVESGGTRLRPRPRPWRYWDRD